MLSRWLCIAVSIVAFTDTAHATDIPILGSAEVLAGDFIATRGGAPRMAIGSLAGAVERKAHTGQPLGGAYALQIGENITAMSATNVAKAAAGIAGGGGPTGFLVRQAAGLAAGSLGRAAFDEVANYKTDPTGSIGGLQAKLADLKSVNGMKDGIQQYDLLDRDFNPPAQKPQQPFARRIPHYDGGPLNPNDELIGRVPDSRNNTRDLGRDFLDALTGGGATSAGRSGCRGVDYASRNPRSCSGY